MALTRILEHTLEMSSWDLSNVIHNNVSYISPHNNLEEFVSHVSVTRRGDILVLRNELKLQDGGPLPPLMSSSISCLDLDFVIDEYYNARKKAHMIPTRCSLAEGTAIWEYDNIIPASYFKDIDPKQRMLLYIKLQVRLNPVADNTQNVTPQQHQLSKKITTDFAALLEKANFSDLVLVTATGKEFAAHKSILSARSSVFAAMFESDMKETHENRVEMENVSDDLMEAMLKFLYSGTLDDHQEVRAGFYEELLAVADQYNVTDLRSAVLDVIKVDVNNFGKLLVLADRHGQTNLKSRVIDFIILHSNDLKNSEGSIF